MRRLVAVLAVLTIAVGMLGGVMPAQATHGCVDPDCNPVSVAVLEGQGYVCNKANVAPEKKRCVYHTDDFWPTLESKYNATDPPGCVFDGVDCTIRYPQWQGLGWPSRHPPAKGPFSFVAGPDNNVPTTTCASTVGSQPDGCKFASTGSLTWGLYNEGLGVEGYGAYCGSSKGTGVSTFTSGDGDTIVKANFGWRQSGATILPLEGKVFYTDPPGGVGATVVGFTSSRGASSGGQNCNITVITDQFQVEGMVVTF